jgi:hypothetical protein
VYVGNLSYDVKYRDLIEFMRGGGWGRFSSWSFLALLAVEVVVTAGVVAIMRRILVWKVMALLEVRESGVGAGAVVRARRHEPSSVVPAHRELDLHMRADNSHARTGGGREGAGFGFLFPVSTGPIVRYRMAKLIVGVISW